MKVKILKSVSGLDFSYKKGDEVNLESKKAKVWLQAGVAKEIKTKSSNNKGQNRKAKAENS